jgi:hypothetical protein
VLALETLDDVVVKETEMKMRKSESNESVAGRECMPMVDEK